LGCHGLGGRAPAALLLEGSQSDLVSPSPEEEANCVPLDHFGGEGAVKLQQRPPSLSVLIAILSLTMRSDTADSTAILALSRTFNSQPRIPTATSPDSHVRHSAYSFLQSKPVPISSRASSHPQALLAPSTTFDCTWRPLLSASPPNLE
jgi:hypothetical protein